MTGSMSLSRRRWLGGMAGAGLAMALKPSALWAADGPDPKVMALVRGTIGIDTHNHVDVALQPDVLPQPDIDLAGAMRRSGLSVICMTFATDYQKIVDPSDGYRRLINGLNATDAQLKRNGMTRSLTAADVRAAHARGRPTVIQAVEGAHWMEGRIDRIGEAYGRGLRHMGLLHDNDAAPPLGDTNAVPFGQGGQRVSFGGLTPLGADAIRECNRLGVLVDLAHASAETCTAALKVSKAPMVFSHTGLNTRLDDDPEVAKTLFGKLVSPEQARAIAQSGGVVGVWTHVSLTPEQYGRNIRAMVDVCGIDHVCLGTDSKMTPALGIGGGPGIVRSNRSIGIQTQDTFPDLRFGFYYAVVDGLLKAGFNAEEIGKIGGGNYLRIFDTAMRHKG